MSRPDQAELGGLAPAPAAGGEQLAHLNADNPRQQPQVVVLVARTGKGKITVRETVGRQGVFAVYPWRLRDRQNRLVRIPTATLRALPWAGSGEDPGMPTGPDEQDDRQQEIGL